MFWLEMNSIPDKAHCPHFRPSFSSLVGRTERPLLFPSSPFCAAAAGFSWAWEFTDLHIGRLVAENTIFRRSGFRFASSNADVSPLLRLLNGWMGRSEEQSFLGGALFSHFHRDVTSEVGDNDWGEMGVPLHPSQNQCVRTETALLLTCVFVCRAAVSI